MNAGRIYGLVLIVVVFAILGGLFKKSHAPNASGQPYIENAAARNDQITIGGSGPGPMIYVVAKNPDVMQSFRHSNTKPMLNIGLLRRSPVEEMHRADGVLQMQMGVNNAAAREGEEGQPVTALYDDQGRQRLLLRLDIKTQAPMIVLRDMQGINRLVMGLNDQSGESDPFLVHINSARMKSYAFGKPTSPPKQ